MNKIQDSSLQEAMQILLKSQDLSSLFGGDEPFRSAA